MLIKNHIQVLIIPPIIEISIVNIRMKRITLEEIFIVLSLILSKTLLNPTQALKILMITNIPIKLIAIMISKLKNMIHILLNNIITIE